MLESLHLRNFRRFEAVDVSFSAGLNGIFGKNYQGKSTLLLAIAVALGAPGWARGLRLARRGQDKFEVQLVFSAAGQRYRVMRSQSTGSLERLIGKGEDKLIASGQTQVNIELGKILGMPVERWLELRFVRQKAASTMFSSGSTKLNLLVEELTGARTVTLVIEQLGRDAKETETKLETLRSTRMADEQLEVVQQNLREAVAEHRDTEAAAAGDEDLLAQLKAALAKLSNQVQAKATDLKSLQADLRKVEGLRRDLVGVQRSLAALPEGDELSAEELAEKVRVHAELLDQDKVLLRLVTEVREEQQRVVADAAKAFAAHSFAADELQKAPRADDNLEELEAQADTSAGTYAKAFADLGNCRNRQQDIRQQMESGVCKSCGQRTDAGEDHTELLQAELAGLALDETRLKNEVDKLKLAQATLKTRIKELRTQLEAEAEAKREVDRLQTAFQLKQERAEEIDKKVKVIEDRLPRGGDKKLREMVQNSDRLLEEKRNRLNLQKQRERDLARLEPELASVTAELAKHPETLTEASVNLLAEEVDGLRRDERAAELKLNSAQSSAASRRVGLANLEKLMLGYTERLEQQQQLVEQLEALEAEQLNAEGLRKYLRDNRSRYLQNAWDLILGRASAFAEGVTDGVITEIRRTEEGAFQYVEAGEVTLADMASGAQEAILGIGVQVALAETLPTALDVFLADEPTADMDADHSSAALLGLSSVSSQALVISHHRMDESICSEVMEL